ncbi:MAG: isocitrate lyase/phosphoenolpyruvate mutase family protein [Pyrinomonadaceae bacterium]
MPVVKQTKQTAAIERFRTLHGSGCFVLPNPWDRGTAIFLKHLGYDALATTSAGFAYSQGLPDPAVPRDLMLNHIRDIVNATDLPVNADFQHCYADDPASVAENVKLCVATGVAGLSIEDSTGNREAPLYEFDLAVERVKAARAAIDETGIPVVLTARCEAWLVGHEEPLRVALHRLQAFAEAGANCLYAPGTTDETEIAQIVRAVAPKPVNVLASRPGFSVSQLADLGVRRISVGSALSRVAWSAFVQAATQIKVTGSFDTLAITESPLDLNKLFDGMRRE